MDLIERQAAIDALDEQIALCDKALNSFGISMKDEYAVKVEKASLVAYKEQLESIPAADVVPVVHGEWADNNDIWLCNNCGKWIDILQGDADMNFCPNCGADMRGEQE